MNFDPNKDYYGILGVTPTAELAVIKAAYKALAAIYHPDRNPSNEAFTNMWAINEAWDILSNPSTRKKYDEAIGDKKPESDAFDETGQSEDEDDAIKDYFEKDWNFALSYYPDLAKHANRLGKISRRLEIAYKAHIVDRKKFTEREEIAEEMEQQFLETYFSSNEKFLSLARKLIFEVNDKKLLKELNAAVSFLGTSDPEVILKRFREITTNQREEKKSNKETEQSHEKKRTEENEESDDQGALTPYLPQIILSSIFIFLLLLSSNEAAIQYSPIQFCAFPFLCSWSFLSSMKSHQLFHSN